jgi:hypothetical protein
MRGRGWPCRSRCFPLNILCSKQVASAEKMLLHSPLMKHTVEDGMRDTQDATIPPAVQFARSPGARCCAPWGANRRGFPAIHSSALTCIISPNSACELNPNPTSTTQPAAATTTTGTLPASDGVASAWRLKASYRPATGTEPQDRTLLVVRGSVS